MKEEDKKNKNVITSASVDGSCSVKISEDKMTAQISLHPSQHGGKPLSLATVEEKLALAGVVYGINIDMLKKLIMTVEKTKEEKEGVIVAKGTPPEDGKDGNIQYHFSDDESILAGSKEYDDRH